MRLFDATEKKKETELRLAIPLSTRSAMEKLSHPKKLSSITLSTETLGSNRLLENAPLNTLGHRPTVTPNNSLKTAVYCDRPQPGHHVTTDTKTAGLHRSFLDGERSPHKQRKKTRHPGPITNRKEFSGPDAIGSSPTEKG